MQYMKKYIKNIVPATFMMLALGATSCIGDLDVDPIDPNIDTNVDLNGLFNKCYANMALAGNGGANGDCDIDGLDGGTTGFIRQLFNSNELTTDEAICGWGDEGVASFCYNTYNASHPMLNGFYARLTTGITYCNQYLAMAGDTDATMSAEIRFVRNRKCQKFIGRYFNITDNFICFHTHILKAFFSKLLCLFFNRFHRLTHQIQIIKRIFSWHGKCQRHSSRTVIFIPHIQKKIMTATVSVIFIGKNPNCLVHRPQ